METGNWILLFTSLLSIFFFIFSFWGDEEQNARTKDLGLWDTFPKIKKILRMGDDCTVRVRVLVVTVTAQSR